MEDSEPLLLHHHHHHHHHHEQQATQNGDDFSSISYTHSPRPLRDLPFLLLFLLFSLSTFALGIFAIFHHNPDYFHSSRLLLSNFLSSHHLPKNLTWTLVITFLLSGPISMAVLFLLRRFSSHLVYASLPLFFLIPTFLNSYWFVTCTTNDSCRTAFPLFYRILLLLFIFLLLALLLWVVLANWHRVRLSVQILHISAEALADNAVLLAVLPLLMLGLAVYYVPVVAFLVYAGLNGKVVLVEKGGGYYYKWKEEGWVPAYYALAVITMVWSLTVMVEAQVYVISGTVAQWYFAKEGGKPARGIRTSLRYIIMHL